MFVHVQQEQHPCVSSELREEGLGSAGECQQPEWGRCLRGKAGGDFPRYAVIFWSPHTTNNGKPDQKCTATLVTPCGAKS